MKKNYSNCFANIKGGCSILKQKLCNDGDCPFYKSKQQNEEDKRKYPYVSYNSKKNEVKANGKHNKSKLKACRRKSESNRNG